jgi:hypothetical protein
MFFQVLVQPFFFQDSQDNVVNMLGARFACQNDAPLDQWWRRRQVVALGKLDRRLQRRVADKLG